MYETEANHRVETLDQIPVDIQERFRDLNGRVLARTVLPWGEHCTECVWPTCYTTCDLYRPREDLRCRRFEDGMVRIPCPGSLNSYLLKIHFKRWGKLWTPGNVRLYSVDQAQKLEGRDYRIGTTIARLPLSPAARRLVTGKRYYFKNTLAQHRRPSRQQPTCFMLECYNPASSTLLLSLTIRSLAADAKIPFQKLIALTHGFQRVRLPVDEIPQALLASPFHLELIPNDLTDGSTLYFGMMDFVLDVEQPPTVTDESRKIKCVVWDLDNTLWDGILIEDGPERLRVKPGVIEVIQELDRRGILQSVASKNNLEDVWPTLNRFQIAEFVLYPQICWAPKNASVENIAQKLNIGLDTVLFVDDSSFELEQVKSACPDVHTLHASEFLSLLTRPDCQVGITAEASSRRKMYQDEEMRQKSAVGFGADYLGFLRRCNLEMTLRPLGRSNVERVHELTQRTNQMNFSGTRYDAKVLEQVLASPHFDTYVIECRDRFGSYGIVGFSIVDRREPRMTDLMFSCRIQAKRVEHAFLQYLLQRYIGEEGRDFWANYRKTSRNAPSGSVFADIGMEEVGTRDGVTSLVFRKHRQVPDDGLITIRSECAPEPQPQL